MKKTAHSLFGGVKTLPRQLNLRQTFFLGIGGQSPLLSLFTYGVAMVGFSAYLSPVVMILGVGLVLANGMVVNRLSSRYDANGGYYTYAFNALSKRLGFQTGWLYIFYSVLYGSAYVFGASYLLRATLGVPVYLTASIVLLPAISLLLLGIRPSSRYAEAAALVEIGLIAASFIGFAYRSHFVFYNPVSYVHSVSAGDLALGILMAAAIPTGFGTIAPISGEVIAANKNVGKSIIYIICTGGFLAFLFVYGLMNFYVTNNLALNLSLNGEHIIGTFREAFGFVTIPIVVFAAVSDGILSALAFMTAASRTIYKMGYDGVLPNNLGSVRSGRPLASSLVAGLAFIAICYFLAGYPDPFQVFLGLGIVSSMAGLLTHIAANASLVRISVSEFRRKLTRNRVMILEALLGVFAIGFSATDLGFTLTSVVPIFIYAFMAWIIVGYVYSDIREMTLDVQDDGLKLEGESPNHAKR